jgi:uncharacterized membrane protein
MIQLNDSITISRSLSEVFAFLADLNNLPKWQSDVVTSNVITPGPTRAGTRFTEAVKLGSLRDTANCEVTDFSPDRLMSIRASSVFIDYEGQVVVEPWDGGTKLSLAVSVQPKGFWRLLRPMVAGEFAPGIKRELAAVKEFLEKE